jgi:hypothetical protein
MAGRVERAETMSAERERAEIQDVSGRAPLPAGGAAEATAGSPLPLTPAMAASLTAHGEASWRAAQVISGSLLAGGVLVGLLNVVTVLGTPPTRVILFLFGFVPCAAIALIVLLTGLRYRRDALRDAAAGTYLTEVGPIHVARTRTAAGILTRGHSHALFKPYPGIVTIVNGSVPSGVYPNATVAYSHHGHFVFTLLDASGRALYRAPGLSRDDHPRPVAGFGPTHDRSSSRRPRA